ncbi:LytR/AlgR family response regulator transcription factor [Aureivirga sp. CE67]|uniref:LytR/AlgR family response regulator transcription factor n=1 Tax=Aureivirga sp. CE67 TaxID=1788983 RepID=UPI0018C97225|nr:LytTR family DNA-binding domain-containing protein [Aureivirga sp. CE67]
MKTVNCIVIDDEFFARKLLIDYIEKVPHLNLLDSFDNAFYALNFVNNNQVDLIFCDIQMPDLTGIDFVKSLNNPPAIIFTTAYAEFAIQGYELDVVDYLMKPFSLPRFIKAVNKACELIYLKKKTEINIKNINQVSEKHYSKEKKSNFILVKSDRKIHKIYFDDILFIEGALEYVNFYTKEKRIMGLYSLKELEEILPKLDFMRVHKSYIVSINKINEIEGNQLLVRENKIPLGRSYKALFFKRFGLSE